MLLVSHLKEVPEWERKHAPMLLSAMAGGQWIQTRRAAVPKWELTDKRCQLCFDAPGTDAHRYAAANQRPLGDGLAIPRPLL